jgi:hypothetical protein
VETYNVPRFAANQTLPALRTHPSVSTAMHLGVWLVGTRTHQETVTLKQRLIAADTRVTTMQTVMAAVSGKRQNDCCKARAAERTVSPRACQRPKQPQPSLLPNRRNWAPAGTTWSEGAASELSLRPTSPPLHPAQEHGLSGSLPHRRPGQACLSQRVGGEFPTTPLQTECLNTLPTTESVTA